VDLVGAKGDLEMEVLKHQMPSRRCNEQGVTLVETLAAMVILSFVAISVLGMFSHGMQLNATGIDYNVLTNAAKDKSEQLLALDYNHVDLTPDVSPAANEVVGAMEITWMVAEHHINEAADNPTAAFGTDPMTSSAAGTGNTKIITITVRSLAPFGMGRRNITLQAIKVTG
jgi:Tfp pilus assembly protein FimT